VRSGDGRRVHNWVWPSVTRCIQIKSTSSGTLRSVLAVHLLADPGGRTSSINRSSVRLNGLTNLTLWPTNVGGTTFVCARRPPGASSWNSATAVAWQGDSAVLPPRPSPLYGLSWLLHTDSLNPENAACVAADNRMHAVPGPWSSAHSILKDLHAC
jgi:hypothetical protein